MLASAIPKVSRSITEGLVAKIGSTIAVGQSASLSGSLDAEKGGNGSNGGDLNPFQSKLQQLLLPHRHQHVRSVALLEWSSNEVDVSKDGTNRDTDSSSRGRSSGRSRRTRSRERPTTVAANNVFKEVLPIRASTSKVNGRGTFSSAPRPGGLFSEAPRPP